MPYPLCLWEELCPIVGVFRRNCALSLVSVGGIMPHIIGVKLIIAPKARQRRTKGHIWLPGHSYGDHYSSTCLHSSSDGLLVILVAVLMAVSRGGKRKLNLKCSYIIFERSSATLGILKHFQVSLYL